MEIVFLMNEKNVMIENSEVKHVQVNVQILLFLLVCLQQKCVMD